jgi:hypothetical protein
MENSAVAPFSFLVYDEKFKYHFHYFFYRHIVVIILWNLHLPVEKISHASVLASPFIMGT